MSNCTNTVDGLVLEKSSSVSSAVVGQTLQFSIAAINQGDQPLYNVMLMDNLPIALQFVPGSVYLGTTNLPTANIATGINVGTLLPGEIKRVKFSVKVVSRPDNGIATNVAIGKFDCLLQNPNGTSTQPVQSNTLTLPINAAQVTVTKQADREEVAVGDAILYTVNVRNTGTTPVNNIIFKDVFDLGFTLVPGSFKINGLVANSSLTNQGGQMVLEAVIGTLLPTQGVTITYQIQVGRMSCSHVVTNKAYATFDYNVNGSACGNGVSNEASTEVEICNNTFKQMSVDGYLTIPTVKPDIEAINGMTGTVDVLSCHVITTPVAQSVGGQTLTGYKLVVTGRLNLSIEYTALTETQQVHSAHYAQIFSTFIILPPTYESGNKIDVEVIVEDIYYQAVDTRNFFNNVTLLVNAKLQCCSVN